LVFEKARAGGTAVQNGDGLGTVLFNGFSNGAYQQSSYITAVADTVPSGSNVYSSLVFFSNHPGATTYENMRITSSGNVGIGTSNPTQKLSVNGTIRAKEIIVDTGWADYVFEPTYRLAPLSEVEQHIKTQKHLPGIPSAAEIATNGASMGDLQTKMMSKIEELTLHLIAQEKEIAELRKQVADMKATSVK
jgi:predicted DNA-binding transcriptional regulator